MNIHVPQTLEARSEALHLLDVKKNIISPKNGEVDPSAIRPFVRAPTAVLHIESGSLSAEPALSLTALAIKLNAWKSNTCLLRAPTQTIVSLIQDFLTCSYLITSKDIFFDKEQF